MESILTIKEVAEILGVSTSTVRRWDSEGLIKSFRTAGGHRRYRESEVRQFINLRDKPDGITFK